MTTGALMGFISPSKQALVGCCFGHRQSGEIGVLAVHPTHEGQGIGQRLLALVVEQLRLHGHTKLVLGWRSTGTLDAHGDELLELRLP